MRNAHDPQWHVRPLCLPLPELSVRLCDCTPSPIFARFPISLGSGASFVQWLRGVPLPEETGFSAGTAPGQPAWHAACAAGGGPQALTPHTLCPPCPIGRRVRGRLWLRPGRCRARVLV